MSWAPSHRIHRIHRIRLDHDHPDDAVERRFHSLPRSTRDPTTPATHAAHRSAVRVECRLSEVRGGCHQSGDRWTGWGHCSRRSRRTLLAFVCEDARHGARPSPGRAMSRAATSGFRISPSRTSVAHTLTMTSVLTWSTLSSPPAGHHRHELATYRTAHPARHPTGPWYTPPPSPSRDGGGRQATKGRRRPRRGGGLRGRRRCPSGRRGRRGSRRSGRRLARGLPPRSGRRGGRRGEVGVE